eukprot:g2491.t1
MSSKGAPESPEITDASETHAPAQTPSKAASSEEVQMLTPSAAAPKELVEAVTSADSSSANGNLLGLLVPTVSRDASEDVTPESKSVEGAAATPAASQIDERVRERSPMDVIGPGNFQKIKLLGKGDAGLVFLVKARNVNQLNGTYAMKVYKKSDIVKRNKVARVKLEREILAVTNHPFVVSMYAAFQTPKRLYVILQYCPGGELYRMVKRQPNGRIPEEWARFYAAEILVAVEYLHFMGYLYRDLKPENILLHASGHVMIADFDLAKRQVHEFSEKEKQDGASVMQFKKSHSHSRTHSSIGTPPSSIVSPPENTAKRKEAHVVVNQRTGQPVVLLNQKSYRFGIPLDEKKKRGSRNGPGCCSCGANMILEPVLDTETQLAVDAFGDHLSTSFVGTVEYIAPEVIMQEGYSGSVDWWTFGVLLYEMVFGKTPFKGKDMNGTLAHVLNADLEFKMPDNEEIPASKELRDLLPRLLEREVSNRLKSPDAIRSHGFFATIAWPLLRHMKPPFVPSVESETDTANFRSFENFVDSDSEFECDGVEGEREEDGGGSGGSKIQSMAVRTPTAKSSEVRESSSDEEEIISPAYNKRNTAVFPNFAYEDKLGEQHWDFSKSPPKDYGTMKHIRGDHIESPLSKKYRGRT